MNAPTASVDWLARADTYQTALTLNQTALPLNQTALPLNQTALTLNQTALTLNQTALTLIIRNCPPPRRRCRNRSRLF